MKICHIFYFSETAQQVFFFFKSLFYYFQFFKYLLYTGKFVDNFYILFELKCNFQNKHLFIRS